MKLIKRQLDINFVLKLINNFQITGIIGARQVGKTTLAKQIASQLNSIYFDLEDETDAAKLSEPKFLFDANRDKLIILDEIQFMPKLFKVLRSYVDKNPESKFLILGSASPDIIRTSSETLAGRIAYYTLQPLRFYDVKNTYDLNYYWLRGGFPRSLIADDMDISAEWRKNFIDTFLYRDTHKFGFNFPPETLKKILTSLALNVGQAVNYSQIGSNFGISHTTVKKYIDYLEGTFIVKLIYPYIPNVKKRLLKSPKSYFSDAGILLFILRIFDLETLLAHPLLGFIWENLVLQQILSLINFANLYYYRTASGSEIDFILEKGSKKIAIECKTSLSPKVTKGFWLALEDTAANEAYIVIPTKSEYYPLKENAFVIGLEQLHKIVTDFESLNY